MMKPQDQIKMLDLLERQISGQKDPKTKLQLKIFFEDLRSSVNYRIPKAPIEVSKDKHHFTCPTCKTAFEAEDDIVDDFNVCYICGQVWRQDVVTIRAMKEKKGKKK